MSTKVFRIISNSNDFLSADIIAEALLKQITLGVSKPNAFFAVMEDSGQKGQAKRTK
jgi:hypothetical protein